MGWKLGKKLCCCTFLWQWAQTVVCFMYRRALYKSTVGSIMYRRALYKERCLPHGGNKKLLSCPGCRKVVFSDLSIQRSSLPRFSLETKCPKAGTLKMTTVAPAEKGLPGPKLSLPGARSNPSVAESRLQNEEFWSHKLLACREKKPGAKYHLQAIWVVQEKLPSNCVHPEKRPGLQQQRDKKLPSRHGKTLWLPMFWLPCASSPGWSNSNCSGTSEAALEHGEANGSWVCCILGTNPETVCGALQFLSPAWASVPKHFPASIAKKWYSSCFPSMQFPVAKCAQVSPTHAQACSKCRWFETTRWQKLWRESHLHSPHVWWNSVWAMKLLSWATGFGPQNHPRLQGSYLLLGKAGGCTDWIHIAPRLHLPWGYASNPSSCVKWGCKCPRALGTTAALADEIPGHKLFPACQTFWGFHLTLQFWAWQPCFWNFLRNANQREQRPCKCKKPSNCAQEALRSALAHSYTDGRVCKRMPPLYTKAAPALSHLQANKPKWPQARNL